MDNYNAGHQWPKMNEPSALSSWRLIQSLPGGGPGVNGTLEDYF
jgi:hypothetical protein